MKEITEEVKLRRAAKLGALWDAEIEKRKKMTPEELAVYSATITDVEPLAAPLEEQDDLDDEA